MTTRLIPEMRPWAEMRADFAWSVPRHFNIAEACCDRWARDDPDRLAITHLGEDGRTEDWTYGDLARASDRFAGSLAAAGVRRGDRIAVVLAQHPAVMIAHFAAYKLGAVILPIFALFSCEALAYRLSDSGAVAVVTDAEGARKINALPEGAPPPAHVYSVDGAADGVHDFWRATREGIPTPRADTLADDPAVLIYTSGTTGAPKGVLHAHRFLIGHLPSIEVHHAGFPQPGDKGWTPADWAWIGGLMDMAMPCLYYGVPQVSHRMRKFDPDHAYDLIRRFGIRNMFLPPTALKLMRAAGVPDDLNIRSIGSGGESLGADLLDWSRAAFGVAVNEIYGQTECNLVMAQCDGVMEVRPGTMGQAVPGFDVAVIDEAGQPVAPGQTGQIAVRGPNPVMFLRYWKKPGKTAEKYRGQWLLTGDLGVPDAEGYITYQGRDDDVITSSGYRIGPTEIENCLTGHPDVVMAAVVGVPDPVRTEAVKAFIVLRDGAKVDGLAAKLTDLVRQRVSPHVAPRSIEFIDEMPMTTTGKIMRRILRDRG